MGKPAPRRSLGVGWIVTWPMTVVLASMVYLSADKLGEPAEQAEPAVQRRESWQERLQERIDTITRQIEGSSLDVGEAEEQTVGSGRLRYRRRTYSVSLAPGERDEKEIAVQLLRGFDEGIEVSTDPKPHGFDVTVSLDGLLTHTIRLREPTPVPTPVIMRVAIVIDGLGDDLRVARSFAESELPLALAVRPRRPFSRQVAELAHLFRKKVLLDLDPPVLPARATGALAEREFRELVAEVPHTVGIQVGPAHPHLEILRDIDVVGRRFLLGEVRELERSPGELAAPVLGRVAVLSRPEQDLSVLIEALERFRERLREEGTLVAVVHGQADAADVLERTVSAWQQQGIDVVSVTSLVRPLPVAVGQ